MSRIFICYRREDSQSTAAHIHDRLTTQFGPENVFIDFDGIPPGSDAPAVIEERLTGCAVMLAIVGKQWLTVGDAQNKPRLFNEGDFVRMEIQEAMRDGIVVIPVTVDRAVMPSGGDLPVDLEPFARKQAVELRHGRFFKQDFIDLIKRIEEHLERATTQERLVEEANDALSVGDIESGVSKLIAARDMRPEGRSVQQHVNTVRDQLLSNARLATESSDHAKAKAEYEYALCLLTPDESKAREQIRRDIDKAERRCRDYDLSKRGEEVAWDCALNGLEQILAGSHSDARDLWNQALRKAPEDKRLRRLVSLARRLAKALEKQTDSPGGLLERATALIGRLKPVSTRNGVSALPPYSMPGVGPTFPANSVGRPGPKNGGGGRNRKTAS